MFIKRLSEIRIISFPAKDLLLVQSLEQDGFNIPKEIKHKDLAKKYNIPATH